MDSFPNSLARQNLSILTKTLHRMEHYWAGVSYVLNTLEQRVTGKYCQWLMSFSIEKLHRTGIPTHQHVEGEEDFCIVAGRGVVASIYE
jgi:hypothetical protein